MDKNDKKKKHEEAIPEEKNSETEELREKVVQLEEWYKRTLADYQNLEKRTAQERHEIIINANRQLLLKILPVLDTLMLANAHVQNEGLEVSIQQFLNVLKDEGVTRIETVDKPFNPHLMECVTIEKGKENTVLEELQPGYMLADKVLRVAKVKVGKEN
ncbi:MAG TPA: nucleotide exchange factor GrpE [Candidatus Saccharimonadales bacterium]|nr:nucleotide exchange factor GrpE [Candidatus Saccharimonadales bacterium]